MKKVLRLFSAVVLAAALAVSVFSVAPAAAYISEDGVCCTVCGWRERLEFVCTGESAPGDNIPDRGVISALGEASLSSRPSLNRAVCLGSEVRQRHLRRTYYVCGRCGNHQRLTYNHICDDDCGLIRCSVDDMELYSAEVGAPTIAEAIRFTSWGSGTAELFKSGMLPIKKFSDWLAERYSGAEIAE